MATAQTPTNNPAMAKRLGDLADGQGEHRIPGQRLAGGGGGRGPVHQPSSPELALGLVEEPSAHTSEHREDLGQDHDVEGGGEVEEPGGHRRADDPAHRLVARRGVAADLNATIFSQTLRFLRSHRIVTGRE